jgi:hypothetical protein
VLYGVPEPDQPFIALIQALSRRFDVLPYGGEHPDIVPHMTVASSGDAALIASIESEVTRRSRSGRELITPRSGT